MNPTCRMVASIFSIRSLRNPRRISRQAQALPRKCNTNVGCLYRGRSIGTAHPRIYWSCPVLVFALRLSRSLRSQGCADVGSDLCFPHPHSLLSARTPPTSRSRVSCAAFAVVLPPPARQLLRTSLRVRNPIGVETLVASLPWNVSISRSASVCRTGYAPA